MKPLVHKSWNWVDFAHGFSSHGKFAIICTLCLLARNYTQLSLTRLRLKLIACCMLDKTDTTEQCRPVFGNVLNATVVLAHPLPRIHWGSLPRNPWTWWSQKDQDYHTTTVLIAFTSFTITFGCPLKFILHGQSLIESKITDLASAWTLFLIPILLHRK